MSVYALLQTCLSPGAATIATALFYAAMLIAILLLLSVAPADFRYGGY